jgi:hypothetical protein
MPERNASTMAQTWAGAICYRLDTASTIAVWQTRFGRNPWLDPWNIGSYTSLLTKISPLSLSKIGPLSGCSGGVGARQRGLLRHREAAVRPTYQCCGFVSLRRRACGPCGGRNAPSTSPAGAPPRWSGLGEQKWTHFK